VDQPLEQLVKLVPDLKKLQPAPDQQLLPMILQKSGAAVDDFVYNVVDVIARETFTQERLNAAGDVTASENVQDDYLILHSANDVREALVEYHMDAKGNRLGPVGLNRGYPFTSGFALTCLYFSTARQSDSTFRYVGQQTIGNRQTWITRGSQRNFLAMSRRCGRALRQGPHQVAQKSTSTTLPSNSSMERREPPRVVTAKGGAMRAPASSDSAMYRSAR
jgi:hypothetical protein